MSPAEALAAEIAAAHGGHEWFRSRPRLAVRFSSGGLAFATKGQPDTLSQVAGEFSTAGQTIRLSGQSPRPWKYRADSTTELTSHLRKLRFRQRRLHWDVDHTAAFAAMAMWTYLALPFLAAEPEARIQVLHPYRGRRRLQVTLPRSIVSHCLQQIFHVDDDGLIRRHDYTALAFGRWARASQTLDDYNSFDGLHVATRRRVVPRVGRSALRGPTLVWIQVHDVRPVGTPSGSRIQRTRTTQPDDRRVVDAVHHNDSIS